MRCPLVLPALLGVRFSKDTLSAKKPGMCMRVNKAGQDHSMAVLGLEEQGMTEKRIANFAYLQIWSVISRYTSRIS